MSKKPVTKKAEAEKVVKDIRRATRKIHSAEEKIRVVLAGLRGEDSIAELCRREGIAQSLYYSWSKEFLEAGKKRLAGDTARQATSAEVQGLRAEYLALKEVVADLLLENRVLKKNTSGLTRRQVADDLGVGLSTLNKWVNAHRDTDLVSPEDRELAHENDFLSVGLKR